MYTEKKNHSKIGCKFQRNRKKHIELNMTFLKKNIVNNILW